MDALNYIYNVTRWCLGGLFVYAGSIKLLEPAGLTVLIEAYGILPDMLLMPVTIILAVSEVGAGIGLMLDLRGSLTILAGLLLLFTAVLAYGLWLGLDIDCGCFGPEDAEGAAFHGLKSALVRDAFMLAAVIYLYGWRRLRQIKPLQLVQLIR